MIRLRDLKYDLKYPQLLCTARDSENLVKTIGEGPCVKCGTITGWSELNSTHVCSEECRDGV